MFIELTDHLRCPADHPERYLVLLPDRIVERSVIAGRLGCPVCGRTWAVAEGVAELGGPPPAPPSGAALDPSCDACVLDVCDIQGDLFCCDFDWDSICVSEAISCTSCP